MVKVDKLTAGFFTGFWAAIAQAWVGVLPPSAFGICFISHPSDLFNWTVNKIFSVSFYVHDPSLDLPVLTVLGVLIGASLATIQHKEFKFRMPRNPLDHYINGFMVAVFGLMLGYCSVHIIMGLTYGSVIALTGFAGMMLGVTLAILYIKWRVHR
ncbi:MAG: cytochrome C [Thaumarchaeota archaeon]|nr:cytochrome C [Nitrososphaerota archaeon]